METYLYHHGILGQKWGVRRYQNEDGTLTEAGKKRYDNEQSSNEDSNSSSSKNNTSTEKSASEKRTVRDLSDEQLRAMINRLELEQRYKTLQGNSSTSKKFATTGKQIVGNIIKNSLTNAGTNLMTQTLTYYGGQGINKLAKKNIINVKAKMK